MAEGDKPGEDRPDGSGRSSVPVNIDPLAGEAEIDKDLDRAARRARFRRNERWENSRQWLVIVSLGAMTLVLLLAFLWSAWVLLPTDPNNRQELARWVLETEVGGLAAGIIGLWVVKSFEK